MHPHTASPQQKCTEIDSELLHCKKKLPPLRRRPANQPLQKPLYPALLFPSTLCVRTLTHTLAHTLTIVPSFSLPFPKQDLYLSHLAVAFAHERCD